MKKSWTGKEQSRFVKLYQKFDPNGCALILNRTVFSIVAKASELNLTSPRTFSGEKRCYFAEDIANMFQLRECGLSNSEIALSYKSTAKVISCLISKAKSGGMTTYPKRLS